MLMRLTATLVLLAAGACAAHGQTLYNNGGYTGYGTVEPFNRRFYADDFQVSSAGGWSVTRITLPVVQAVDFSTINTVDVRILPVVANAPGAAVYSASVPAALSDQQPIGGVTRATLTLDLSTPAALAAGNYYLSLRANLPDPTERVWWGETTASGLGPYQSGDGITYNNSFSPPNVPDGFSFQLIGTPVPEPGLLLAVAAVGAAAVGRLRRSVWYTGPVPAGGCGPQ